MVHYSKSRDNHQKQRQILLCEHAEYEGTIGTQMSVLGDT